MRRKRRDLELMDLFNPYAISASRRSALKGRAIFFALAQGPQQIEVTIQSYRIRKH
jgi:hypothetical protein